MTEILSIQLDSKLKNAFHRRCEVLQIPVDKVVEQLIQNFLDATVPRTATIRDDNPEINRFIGELAKDVQISGDELFFGDLTDGEYFALLDAEREALWNEAYRQELDRTESAHKEREAHPDAIPSGQGRSAEVRRRLKELRNRQKPD